MRLLWVVCADSYGHFVLLHALQASVDASHTLASILSPMPFNLVGHPLPLHKKRKGQT